MANGTQVAVSVQMEGTSMTLLQEIELLKEKIRLLESIKELESPNFIKYEGINLEVERRPEERAVIKFSTHSPFKSTDSISSDQLIHAQAEWNGLD
jgi:hypothetical protein